MQTLDVNPSNTNICFPPCFLCFILFLLIFCSLHECCGSSSQHHFLIHTSAMNLAPCFLTFHHHTLFICPKQSSFSGLCVPQSRHHSSVFLYRKPTFFSRLTVAQTAPILHPNTPEQSLIYSDAHLSVCLYGSGAKTAAVQASVCGLQHPLLQPHHL